MSLAIVIMHTVLAIGKTFSVNTLLKILSIDRNQDNMCSVDMISK